MRAVMSVVAAIEDGGERHRVQSARFEKLDNPYPHYHRLRRKTRCIGAAWDRGLSRGMRTRLKVFADKRLSTTAQQLAVASNAQAATEAGRTQESWIIRRCCTRTRPRHTRLRSLVSQAFTPNSVGALAPRIQKIVHDLLDEAERNEPMTYYRTGALPSVIVIAEMLGIRAEDREQFGAGRTTFLRGMDTRT